MNSSPLCALRKRLTPGAIVTAHVTAANGGYLEARLAA